MQLKEPFLFWKVPGLHFLQASPLKNVPGPQSFRAAREMDTSWNKTAITQKIVVIDILNKPMMIKEIQQCREWVRSFGQGGHLVHNALKY